MRYLPWIAGLILLITVTPCAQAVAGHEVVVVYNSRVPQSRDLAEYYAAKRDVPPRQVLGLSLPTGDVISREDYTEKLEQRLLRFLGQRDLCEFADTRTGKGFRSWHITSSRVRYLVLFYGVPYKIAADPRLIETEAASLRPELRRNEAALDSELAALPRSHPAVGFVLNPAHAATNTTALHPTNGILIVARLDGPTPEIVRRMIDQALEAEAGGLWGRAYVDLRNTSDPAMASGDASLATAAEVCRRAGYETFVDDRPSTFPTNEPMPQIAFYAGWYDEHVSGPFTGAAVEFMPGAFAYHLHSFSGAELRDPQKNWVGPLLAKGATISMGTVWEPFLPGTPDIGLFGDRLLNRGFSFGEAAYAAQGMLSWQTIVVGDPLYTPARVKPQELSETLAQRLSPRLEWALLRLVDINRANSMPVGDLALFLERQDVRKTSAVLTERLADLYMAQGKPASAKFMYEQALGLDPSPQQRLRIERKARVGP